MAMIDEVDTLRTIETSLANNKVVNVAYDDTAYAGNDADGVSIYDYDNHNNIPVKTLSVLKINETVSLKGFRSIASTLPRMFINHIYGRISYNLNKIVDNIKRLLDALHNYLGQPNGIATLDSDGRLPYSQLPLTAVEYKGAWNADTNTPALASGTGTYGDMYIVSVAGTQDLGEGSTDYKAGDRVIYNGSVWQRFQVGDVHSVNGVEADGDGNVTITGEDIASPDVYIPSDTSVQTDKKMKSCVFANDMFVAGLLTTISGVTYGIGLGWSEDGKTWNQSNITTGTFDYIVYGNGIWVTGSNAGLLWSDDGKTWHQSNLTEGSVTHGIAYGNRWVACLNISSSNYQTYWSDDGKTWTACSYSTSYMYASAILYANGIWVAKGMPSPYIWWSEDGKTWTAGTSASGTTLYQMADFALTYQNGLWIAGNGYTDQRLVYSTNGKSWSTCLGEMPYSPQNVVYTKGKWFACSNNSNLFYSSDGINWDYTLPSGEEVEVRDYRILLCDDTLVITGASMYLTYSLDGDKFIKTSIRVAKSYTYGKHTLISVIYPTTSGLTMIYNEFTNKISDLFSLFYKIVKGEI